MTTMENTAAVVEIKCSQFVLCFSAVVYSVELLNFSNFPLFSMLSSQECRLKGYPRAYFMRKNEKKQRRFCREERGIGKVEEES